MTAPFGVPAAVRLLVGGLLACVAAVVAVLALSIAGASSASAAITGVDVASYQHPGGAPIDWRAVAAAGHRFAYVKATEATSYTNPYFANDWSGIGAAGMYRGAYHYAKPQLPISTAAAQAQYFVSRTGSSTGAYDLPLELDLEESGGLGQADLANWTRTFLAEVTRLTGKKPLVYTGRWFWSGSIGAYGNDIGQTYVLWTADYHCQRTDGSLWCDPNTDTYNSPVFGGWQQWTFWQNYSVGVVPGISGDVDMSRFCCDLATLASLGGAAAGAGSPFGSVDLITPVDATHATISGWVIDPDTRGPTLVHVYPNGAGTGSTATVGTANVTRTDVGAVYPSFGPDHGYSITVPIGPGVTQLCAYGINVAGGSNVLLGCLSVGTPFGYADIIASPQPGRIRVAGWLQDPDDPTATVTGTVTFGNQSRDFRSDMYRSDVGNHAYDLTFDSPGGHLNVCVVAHNAAGAGGDAAIRCAALDLPTGSPFGSVDVLAGGSSAVMLAGWAIDPDTVASIPVHVYVDGVGVAVLANADRSDLLATPGYAPYGAAHGFNALIAAAPGWHSVCVYGIESAGSGSNTTLTCRTVLVFGPDPFGSFDVARGVTRAIVVAGWAIDPDTTRPTQVHIYLDGAATGLVADGSRPDVAANPAYSAFGPNHGFTATIPATPGFHSVCAYAINMVGAGSNQSLGCRPAFVNTGAPFGNVDVVTRVDAYGVVTIAGWAIDPKVTTPSRVHVYINGRWSGVATANVSRPDVDAAFGYGPIHGFSYVGLRVGSGPQTVCAYAIDSATTGGTNTLLGCRTV